MAGLPVTAYGAVVPAVSRRRLRAGRVAGWYEIHKELLTPV